MGDSVDQKNRIEVTCKYVPVPFHELIDSRIVKIKILPGKDSNGGHSSEISMITERNGNFYEVKLEGDVTECSERGIVTNGNESCGSDGSMLAKIKKKFQKWRNKKYSQDRIEIIERNGEIVIKKE